MLPFFLFFSLTMLQSLCVCTKYMIQVRQIDCACKRDLYRFILYNRCIGITIVLISFLSYVRYSSSK